MINKHTIMYALSKFIPSGMNFITLSMLSYLLAPDALGKYTIMLTEVMLLNSLLFQWIRISLLRYFNKYTNNEKESFINVIMSLTFIVFVIALIIAITLLQFPEIKDNTYVIYGFLWLVSYSIYDINLELHRSSLQADKYAKIELYRSISFFIFSGISIYFFKNSEAVIINYIISLIIPLIIFKSDHLKIKSINLDKNIFKKVIYYGLPLAIMVSSSYVNNVVDRLLIAKYLGSNKVALYAVGYDIFKQFIWLPFVIINLANYPVLLKLHENGKHDELRDKLKYNVDTLCLISLMIAYTITINGTEFSLLCMGKPYRETALLIMPYVFIGTVMYGLSVYHFNNAFQFKEKTKQLSLIYIIGAGINIISNIILLPRLGLIGAAYSTVISYASILLMSVFIGSKHYKTPLPSFSRLIPILVGFVVLKETMALIHIDNIVTSIIFKTSCVVLIAITFAYKLNYINSENIYTIKKRLSIKQN